MYLLDINALMENCYADYENIDGLFACFLFVSVGFRRKITVTIEEKGKTIVQFGKGEALLLAEFLENLEGIFLTIKKLEAKLLEPNLGEKNSLSPEMIPVITKAVEVRIAFEEARLSEIISKLND